MRVLPERLVEAVQPGPHQHRVAELRGVVTGCGRHHQIGQHLEASDKITPSEHKKRAGLLNRVRWNASWFLVAVVDYTVSRRLNLGL